MAVHNLGDGVRLWTRTEWRAKRPRKMTEHQTLREVFIHHTDTADAEALNSLAEQKAAMRGFQAFHQNVKRFADLGYAFVIFQPYGGLTNARVFQGRLTKFVPAGQLRHNTGTVPICVVGDFQGDDGVKDATITAIIQTIWHVQEHHNNSLVTVGGHRDVVATSCPGDTLYRKIPEIARKAGLRRF